MFRAPVPCFRCLSCEVSVQRKCSFPCSGEVNAKGSERNDVSDLNSPSLCECVPGELQYGERLLCRLLYFPQMETMESPYGECAGEI